MWITIIFFLLSIFGIGETIYLIKKRLAAQHPVCFIGHKCEMVMASKYNKIFLFHNDVWGLLAYGFILLLNILIIAGVPPFFLWSIILKIAVAFGALMSLIFIFLMWRIIKSWCSWCVMSALNFFLMGLILLVSYLF